MQKGLSLRLKCRDFSTFPEFIVHNWRQEVVLGDSNIAKANNKYGLIFR